MARRKKKDAGHSNSWTAGGHMVVVAAVCVWWRVLNSVHPLSLSPSKSLPAALSFSSLVYRSSSFSTAIHLDSVLYSIPLFDRYLLGWQRGGEHEKLEHTGNV